MSPGAPRSSGKPAAQMLVEHDVWAQAQPMTTRCDCGWYFRGTTRTALEAAATHRRDRHPERKRTRHRSMNGSPAKFLMRKLDPEELTEIERERVRRAFLHGVEIEG